MTQSDLMFVGWLLIAIAVLYNHRRLRRLEKNYERREELIRKYRDKLPPLPPRPSSPPRRPPTIMDPTRRAKQKTLSERMKEYQENKQAEGENEPPADEN